MLKIGLGKVDITPRVGVGLYGYGSYLTRFSTGVREPLYARALAFSDDEQTGVIVSCDLVGVSRDVTDRVRELVRVARGADGVAVCVHCIHTHCGPRTKFGLGQGMDDAPYREILPHRIARACTDALAALTPAGLAHTVVPCVGIGYNREDDQRPSYEDATDENWRPVLPDRTDTEAHVLRFDSLKGELIGFASYFSCHPVVGSSGTRDIHSDFVGIATNWLEREHPGSIGLFLQGCEGNTNSCFVHHGAQESLLALDVLAARYARQIRPGIPAAMPIDATPIRSLQRTVFLSRQPLPREELEGMLAEHEAVLAAPGASDADPAVRRATVFAIALRRELARQDAGVPFDDAVELQGFRVGPLLLLGAPFEIMIRYKQRIQAAFDTPTLVLSLCNDTLGYAPERESFAKKGNYAAKVVPYLLGYPPFAPSVEDELVAELTALGQDLLAGPSSA
ncbi:MAG: hypothetical protein HN742_03900 [Lentisphaerae bacterium]|jgi:hypothetical protein|nr:hypothetical protein [Lentisphaerota bacterium]MBT4820856.1 hypothetical protein [Lentisphaerota bacterium]MBT5607294.1 hypothetical protein [Lentisphaerota bacterium]MBT7055388.1 hypothetical protein [Lentisphaerota bacterium]MBT7840986.1 hypothetical protein [Lentisphaerota bacterium]